MRRRQAAGESGLLAGADDDESRKDGRYDWESSLVRVAGGVVFVVSLFAVVMCFDDGTGSPGPRKDHLLRQVFGESDDEVMKRTRDEIKEFISSKGATEPTLGISRGRYFSASTHGLRKLHKSCNFDPYNATEPPRSLLRPGRLADRQTLPDMSLCFLFYSQVLWTRATGGAKGVSLTRIGAAISDKEVFAEAVQRYRENGSCSAGPAGVPTSVLLGDQEACELFFNDNRRWSTDRQALWFIKDANGSLGRHISLLRQDEISELASTKRYTCPMEGRVASLEVPNMWTPRLPPHRSRHKFDHRYYVLVPSVDPLIILIRGGYLRFSAANYTQTRQSGEDAEEDRKRHVTNLAVQLFSSPDMDASVSREVVRPVSLLAELLAQERGGRKAGEEAAQKLRENAHKAILQALFALRSRLRPPAADSGRHPWGFFAVDVAYDTSLNAYVLDVNTGPAPTGTGHAEWYLGDRSATVREAVDMVQDAAFRVLARRWMAAKGGAREGGEGEVEGGAFDLWASFGSSGEWKLLFHDGREGGVPSYALRFGDCYERSEG